MFLLFFSGERPYKCTLCNRAFNQKGALRIHMSKHTGDKPFICDFCPHTFAQKGNLRAHIKVKCVLILQRLGIKSINFYSCSYICPTFGFCSIAYVSLKEIIVKKSIYHLEN